LEALLGGLPGWSGLGGAKPAAGAPMAAIPEVGPAGQAGPPVEDPYAPAAPAPGQPTPGALLLDEMVGPAPALPPPLPHDSSGGGQRTRLEIDQIASNPIQPRQTFDTEELQTLAESIVAHGLLQPVVVRRVGDRFELVAGERRLQAAKRAGWTDVPVNIIEADDRQTAELAIVENLHRKDLNPLEKAASFHRYLEHYGCTQEELAGRLNLDRSTIANLIRLLELPEPVQEAIRQGKITQGHARAMLPLGDEREQIAFCERIQKEELNVRQTEGLVQELIERVDRGPLGVIGHDGKRSRPRKGRSEHVAALEQQFRAALGTRVKLTHDAKGRGKLEIHFQSHEEFERIRQQICGPAPGAVQVQAG
jgi:ParB family chromosome partitioning protein